MRTAFLTLVRVGLLALCWFMFTTSALQAQETPPADTAAPGEPPPASWCPRPHVSGGGRLLARLTERLDLSSRQRDDIEAILASERSELEPLMARMRANRQTFRALPADGTFDENGVRALADEQAAILTEMIVIRERVKAGVFGVLTDEQRQRAEDMLAVLDKGGPPLGR